MLSPLLIGIGLGILLTVPLAYLWNRRTARRVRHLEQRARAAERLAELGTLTGGLAHEIKNPLSTIGLNVQLLQEDLDAVAERAGAANVPEEMTDRVRRRFNSLTRETTHLRGILEDFLRFAGRMELDREPTDVNALVDELTDFFQPQAQAAGVHLRTQLAADPADAAIDAGLVKQALLNLMINATQAMQTAREKNQPHGGADELILRTERARHLGEEEVRIHVIDTGPGIPAEVQQKVFQPYFSTKKGGSGLGLATARRIAEEHGGRLAIHAAPGRGTEFTLCLPVQPVAPTAPDTNA
ncbi:MAG: two-component system sensor histidine kinase NtrB [Phycisphaeraceae bacterium]